MTPRIEVVCCSADDCVAAERAGADRIELCSAIDLGGLTPSVGLLQESKARTKLPILAMVRPRQGGFCYSEAEFATMKRDVEMFRAHGADGVVFGILLEDGSVDTERNAELVRLAYPLQTVFHRAFDATPGSFNALEAIIQCGFTRILTSGQNTSAEAGADLVSKLIAHAAGRIEIIPGGGLRAANLSQVLRAARATQAHLGPFRQTPDHSTDCASWIDYGKTYPVLDEEEIRRAVHA